MRIAIVVFDGAEELDFAGPWEVLAYWAREPATDAEVQLVADSLDPVRAAKDLRVLPDTTWDAARQIDVLVLPGGRGTRALVEDTALHKRLRDNDGDVITAAGVSAGIDMAPHLVARLDSPDAARGVKRGIQYDPQPPV